MALLPVTFIDPLQNGSHLGLLWLVYNTCRSYFTWGWLLAFAQYWVERPWSLWPYYLGNSCPAQCSILPVVDAYPLNTILENSFYFCALILSYVSCPFSNCVLCFTHAGETYFSTVAGTFGAVTCIGPDLALISAYSTQVMSLSFLVSDGEKWCVSLLISRLASISSMIRIWFWYLLSNHLIAGAEFFGFHSLTIWWSLSIDEDEVLYSFIENLFLLSGR